tara:strand:+ start:576 stop:794 length:219 start_codon:yes stop_codon:yes gene_type:complete
MEKTIFKNFLSLLLLTISPYTYAYLGPGIGGGALAATLGIIIALFAAIFGLIWFPLKRFFKKRKENKENEID